MEMENFLRFPGFLVKACTLSYDDGVKDDARLADIMRKYGLKGTFNINSKNIVTENERCLSVEGLNKAYGDDFEIALHGYNHLSLAKVSGALALRDVVSDREYLEKTFGRVVRGMAYANGSFNEDVIEILRMAGVAYSRTTHATHSFDIPENWLALDPTCHHVDPELFALVDKFLEPENTTRQWSTKPKLFYLWGHSYEFPRDNNWDVIEKFGEIMSKRDDIWHATNIEVYKYVEAFKRLVFSLDLSYVENPSAIDVYLFVSGKQVIAKAGETTYLK